MRNSKNEKFYLGSALAVIVIIMLFLTLRFGFSIGGSLGQFIILLSVTLIFLTLLGLSIAYYFLIKRK